MDGVKNISTSKILNKLQSSKTITEATCPCGSTNNHPIRIDCYQSSDNYQADSVDTIIENKIFKSNTPLKSNYRFRGLPFSAVFFCEICQCYWGLGFFFHKGFTYIHKATIEQGGDESYIAETPPSEYTDTIPFKILTRSFLHFAPIRKYPVIIGNTCSIGSFPEQSYYCANMFVENILRIKELNPEINFVKVKIFDNLCFVTDERILLEWRSSFTLVSDSYSFRTEIKALKKALDFAGVSHNNFICGCEKDHEYPLVRVPVHLSTGGNPLKTCVCKKCGRSWKWE